MVAQDLFNSRGNGGVEGRHYGGEDSSIDLCRVDLVDLQDIFNIDRIFCAGLVVVGSDPLHEISLF
jgi:hypothetical protein